MISPGDNIVIIGDSWGCGEWLNSSKVVHTGLEYFLSEYGCNVVNLAVGASSNSIQICNLLNYLKDNDNTDSIDCIIWFQTDPIRDLGPYNQEFFPQSVSELVEAGKKLLEKSYKKLNNIGITVYCLGGVAKLEDSINNYPNLVPVIPSIIEMFGGVQPEYWVGAWVDTVKLRDEFLTELESVPPLKSLEDWANLLPRQWFYPDGSHPNRDAHYKIFQHIINQHK